MASSVTTLDRSISTERYDLLALYALMSAVLLGVGGWLTALGLGPWYWELRFPPFQPPAWAFTPVWIVVLSLLALATWRVARREGEQPGVGIALALYGVQCGLNAGWSLLFFTLARPDVALWELLVLDGVVVGMIFSYRRISTRAGLELVPYLGWLLLSTAINWWIVEVNAF